MKCGLLGRKLGHSYSPQIHSHLGSYSYLLYEKEPEQLEDFLKNGDFTGINVTIPYKKDVIPYLDELTPIAKKLGAVNTIVRKNGRLIGHNTDYFGFQSMLQRSNLNPRGKKCLVCGTGGASNTVVAVLQEWGANVVVLSRKGPNTYENISAHQDAAIVVNCTPVGMYPNVGEAVLNLDLLPHLEGVLDVVYNPARTQILLDAEKRGLTAMNGLWMLVAQAKAAAEMFTGKPISDDAIGKIHRILRHQMENIILIGMPGCGKSTIGRLLAEKTGKDFVDTDAIITSLAGKSIPDIFAQDGEDAFRRWESMAIAQTGMGSGLIIATGGGCVTKARNYPLLHQNGTLFWIQRDLDILPTDGRPLSQSNRLVEMYQTRAPMYKAFADHIVDNNGAVMDTVDAILNLWEA